MSKLSIADIKNAARAVLAQHPAGMRYADLFRAIQQTGPLTPTGTIQGGLRSLRVDDQEIILPEKGLWTLKALGDVHPLTPVLVGGSVKYSTSKPLEDVFYKPFAEWLQDSASEATETLAFGGATLKSKWGTPDVVGTLKPTNSDFVKFSTEIISAEIKADQNQNVVAFGQACAYRLFSHRVYIVIPELDKKSDDRIEGLCSLFGFGLVTFDLDAANPNFRVLVRAQRHQPDMFYANEFARQIYEYSKKDFNRLF